MVQKRVCILTLGVGSGHLRASEAVQRALYDSNDPMESKVVDALDSSRRWFHWLYVDPYWWMLRNAPWLWRGFSSADSARGIAPRLPIGFFAAGAAR